jgi:hypothetical protein
VVAQPQSDPRLLALIVVAAACSGTPAVVSTGNTARPTPAPPAAALAEVSVCVAAADAPTASWPGARYPGKLFVAVDDKGYLGTLRIHADTHDCDDCAGVVAVASFVDGAMPPRPECARGFGPVTAPMRHARIVEHHSDPTHQHAASPWAADAEVDLDGDGRIDFTVVTRCAEVMPSGCNDHVCNRTCRGVRRPGEVEPAASSVVCQRLVPDVDDCRP